ncbi:CPBP family intramembrane glutamic endopeptidase [Flavobacterium sp. ASW18X]|uniref:CPBP family intramembrane glutamic endopeptidase n=1 Tax=Flavobacterium sp. ASW18X TaxID=2572595 RepID=UPI00146BF7BC|nr:CPBP family intramembrane glutamic endopeptidase [Flavobacterium sp. ASW18X]
MPLRISTSFKKRILYSLLGWQLLFAISIGMFAGVLQKLLALDFGEHSVTKLLEEYSGLQLLLFAVVLAPILEEVIFRGPLYFFRKWSRFKYVFYLLSFLFGIMHMFNYQNYDDALWFAPLLVAPQLVTGIFLGYARIKLGLLYSIALHALFNGILVGPFLFIKLIQGLA